MAPITQEQILLTLIQGTDGEIWVADRKGWKKDSYHVCEWDGVYCSLEMKDQVTKILLASTNLKATIPTELGLLTQLTDLSLSSNYIYGDIPGHIAQLPNLITINLSNNHITGSIPLFASQALQHLDLSSNRLNGMLPDTIGAKHEQMIVFDVSENKISGPIPESFSSMFDLEKLLLSNNRITGTIPSSVGAARSVHSLLLDNNKLMGTIPPSLARFSSAIGQLWLQGNLLSGTIPPEMSDMPILFEFFVDNNKLTGEVPQELCRSNLNIGFFEDVQDVEEDYCDAIACPVHTISMDGIYPCVKCSDEHANPYLGQVGRCKVLEEIDILQIIYNSTGGRETWIKNQWDFELVEHHCDFAGVECDEEQFVKKIILNNVGLIGTIPSEIGFLKRLEYLDLSDNVLTGFIPSDLRWAPLKTLDVSGNFLVGIVPLKLCQTYGVNGNGVGEHSLECDFIACPLGSFSNTGKKNPLLGDHCIPCDNGETMTLGSKSCIVPHTEAQKSYYMQLLEDLSLGAIVALIILTFLRTGLYYYFIRKLYMHVRKLNTYNNSEQIPTTEDDLGLEDEIEFSRYVNEDHIEQPITTKEISEHQVSMDMKEVLEEAEECLEDIDLDAYVNKFSDLEPSERVIT